MPLFAISTLLWLISTTINLIVMTWFAYKKIDLLEQYLSDCKGVMETKILWRGGVKGRQMRLSMVFAFMYMPGVWYRRGDITKDAHLNIPRRLRREVWVIYIWLFINCGWLAISYFYVKNQP